ncbi:MAG: hypothetical protein ABIJ92_00435 [Candidatus Aenigmatarchaeota archaeon]
MSSIWNFFKLTESKAFLVASILITNSIFPFFNPEFIILYTIIYYGIACIIVAIAETLLSKKSSGSIKPAIEATRFITMIAGAIFIALGLVVLDFAFAPYVEMGSMNYFEMFSGYLLLFIGVAMIALSKMFHKLSKSILIRLVNFKKFPVDPKMTINVISSIILVITVSVYLFQNLGSSSTVMYVASLLLLTGFFIWFLLRNFK